MFFFCPLTIGSFVSLLELAFSFTCNTGKQKPRKLHLRDMNSNSTSFNKGEFAGDIYCFKTNSGKQNQTHLYYKKGTSRREFCDVQVCKDASRRSWESGAPPYLSSCQVPSPSVTHFPRLRLLLPSREVWYAETSSCWSSPLASSQVVSKRFPPSCFPSHSGDDTPLPRPCPTPSTPGLWWEM